MCHCYSFFYIHKNLSKWKWLNFAIFNPKESLQYVRKQVIKMIGMIEMIEIIDMLENIQGVPKKNC